MCSRGDKGLYLHKQYIYIKCLYCIHCGMVEDNYKRCLQAYNHEKIE
jgi:hypothetical protein